MSLPAWLLHQAFQSTPPMREATWSGTAFPQPPRSFNPRLPCGRRPDIVILNYEATGFNPRLPCGRRRAYIGGVYSPTQFQSTPPMREATMSGSSPLRSLNVSIHASHAGGDQTAPIDGRGRERFNPRLPCGRRLRDHVMPLRLGGVSIHASHAGGDDTSRDHCVSVRRFNPRLPCGRRRSTSAACSPSSVFQSTPPMREATSSLRPAASGSTFQSTPPMREATIVVTWWQ